MVAKLMQEGLISELASDTKTASSVPRFNPLGTCPRCVSLSRCVVWEGGGQVHRKPSNFSALVRDGTLNRYRHPRVHPPIRRACTGFALQNHQGSMRFTKVLTRNEPVDSINRVRQRLGTRTTIGAAALTFLLDVHDAWRSVRREHARFTDGVSPIRNRGRSCYRRLLNAGTKLFFGDQTALPDENPGW